MPTFSYRTIQFPVTGLHKEKGSKFLSFAYPVDSEASIKEKTVALRKEYFDARHHCYAWMLGAAMEKFRAFDDGEPNHSAGDPILGQIKSRQLTNLLIVVVRYFGGTKLGVGGLISAYKAAAEDALNKACVVEKEVIEMVLLHYGYSSTPEVMRLVKEFNLTIINQKFEDLCQLQLEVKIRDHESIIDRINLFKAMGVDVTLTLII